MKREKEEQQSAIDGSLADMRRMRSEHKEIRDSVTRAAQKKDQMKQSVAQLEQRVGRLKAALKEQRQLLNSLVGLYARQSGEQHGHVHAELRRICGGPAVSHATVAQLQARIDVLRARVRS